MVETSEELDVLYVIGCFKGVHTGAGGHYHSLKYLNQNIDLKTRIVVVGDFLPSALNGVENVELLRCRRSAVWSRACAEFARRCKAKVVHAFDQQSAPFAGWMARAMDAEFVVTKPGGPRLHRLHSVYRNMVLFHQADLDDVAAKPKPPARVALIPHRVPAPDVSNIPEDDPFEDMPPAVLRLLTIGRVAQAYEEKILQAMALRETLAARLGPVNLCVLGVVQDAESAARMRAAAGDDPAIVFRDEPRFTHNASRFLARCDAAVGTGRGFMEALAYGAYAFFPVKGERLPCFATDAAYHEAFAENFSPRVVRSAAVDPEAALEVFLQAHEEGGEAWRAWAEETFRENHSLEEGAARHKAFYAELDVRESRMDLIMASARAVAFSVLLRLFKGR